MKSALLALLLLAPGALLTAAELTLSAPLDYQVIQRGSAKATPVRIVGALSESAPATIEARLLTDQHEAAWQKVDAKFKARAFEATLDAPAGGWYKLEVRAVAEGKPLAQAAVTHVGVGEVFVVAGQSNSANHGEEKQSPTTGRVVAYDGRRWQLANDPQPGASGNGGSFLPPLGDALVKQFDVPVGFIACGIGATSVREWLPPGSTFPNPPTIETRVEKRSDSAWASKGAAYDMLLARMKSAGPHGFRAVLWHQGESDANQKDATRTLPGNLYREYLEKLIKDSRRDIGWEAPWFVAQVSYHNSKDNASPEIRAAQASLGKDGIALAGPDSDLLQGDLRERHGQGVHFSGPGLKAHGEKWAAQIIPWLKQQVSP